MDNTKEIIGVFAGMLCGIMLGILIGCSIVGTRFTEFKMEGAKLGYLEHKILGPNNTEFVWVTNRFNK